MVFIVILHTVHFNLPLIFFSISQANSSFIYSHTSKQVQKNNMMLFRASLHVAKASFPLPLALHGSLTAQGTSRTLTFMRRGVCVEVSNNLGSIVGCLEATQ